MKIGIFDSGLGGLVVARAIQKGLPEYDYVYLGDTKRVPYGNRSHEAVFEFTQEAMDYLFRKENCAIVIIACNTVSAQALRKMQQEYLPKEFPERKILGVLIPALEEATYFKKIGILATRGTVESKTFPIEIKKILALRNFGEGGNQKIKVFQNSAPMLVPLVEEGETKLAKPFLQNYLKPFLNKNIDALILGCTHYILLKKEIKKILARRSFSEGGLHHVKIISQDEIIPEKLKNYFARHPEIENKLSKKGTTKILVTDMTQNIKKLSQKWFGETAKPRLVNI